MRSILCGLICALMAASAWAQAPGQGGFNNQGAAPGQAGAQPGPGAMPGPPPNAMFSMIDVDGDGVITKMELRKAVAALKKLDTDGDGNITLAEVSPPGGPLGNPAQGDPAQFVDRMMQSDLNGDGVLQGDELQGPMAHRMLQEGDQNQDGALDRNEITAAMQNMRNQFGAGPGGPNAGPGAFQGGFRGGAGRGNLDPQQMTAQMMQFDKNGDGQLSPAEVPQEARRMLGNADQDGDGLLSPAELQAVNQRMGERMRGAQGRGFRGRAAQDGGERGGPQRQPPGTP